MLKSNTLNGYGKFRELVVRHLFQTILVDTLSSSFVGCSLEMETCRFLHQGHHEKTHFEHPFDEETILWLQQFKQTMNSDKFWNKWKGLIIVCPLNLCVPFGDQASFIAFNALIRLILKLVYPFASNGFLTSRKRRESPSIIFFQCLDFRAHSFLPLRILFNLRNVQVQ